MARPTKAMTELMKANVEHDENYKVIVSSLIDAWDIKESPEVMMVNRMVAIWMKMRRVEKMLGDTDLYYEKKDETGTTVHINVNQLAYYLASLEKDFRSYYKILATKNNSVDKTTDFMDFIETKEKK